MLALLFRVSKSGASGARDAAAAAAAGAEAGATGPSTQATSTSAAGAPSAPAAVADVGPIVLEASGTVRTVAGWASMSETDREWTRRQADHAVHIMCACRAHTVHNHAHATLRHTGRRAQRGAPGAPAKGGRPLHLQCMSGESARQVNCL